MYNSRTVSLLMYYESSAIFSSSVHFCILYRIFASCLISAFTSTRLGGCEPRGISYWGHGFTAVFRSSYTCMGNLMMELVMNVLKMDKLFFEILLLLVLKHTD